LRALAISCREKRIRRHAVCSLRIIITAFCAS
jgi:hypothetical protein